ncbi:PIN domain-containing protein [Nocardia nova]|uniref:type II toxin-antitoxin system VapC family toxin n=1 Tax=Nocardia nova TaxID=37330 RepID=UPI001C43B92C|nr:PIN domain-containing protein [Nocardia nova]MBV7702840.1 PIN domain-containing protein [Nocardia nova]
MTKSLPRVAVDTCVVVDLLTNVDPVRAANAGYLLDGHGTRYEIVLPAIVLTEIAGTGEIRGNHLPADVRGERVAAAISWISASRFIVAELSERLARKAADLAVEHQLKGPDGSVLATAMAWRCGSLYTRDNGILKCAGKFHDLKILEPQAPPEPELDLFSAVPA